MKRIDLLVSDECRAYRTVGTCPPHQVGDRGGLEGGSLTEIEGLYH